MFKSAMRWNALVLILLLAACGGGDATAEDDAEDGGEEAAGGPLVLTGDSIYTAEVKINMPADLDHSSAKAITQSLMKVRNLQSDPEIEKKGKEIQDELEAMKMKELERMEALLLTEEAREALETAREESDSRPDLYDSETSEPEITAEEKQDDGSVMIETKAVRTTRQRDSEDAEWEEETEDVLKRVYCVKEGGKWYVDRVESYVKDYANSTADKSSWKWERDTNTPVHVKYRIENSPHTFDYLKKAPEIKTGSARETAESLMGGLLKLESDAGSKAFNTLFKYMADEYAPAFSKAAHERAKERVTDDMEMPGGYEVVEVVKLSDTESEVKIKKNPGSDFEARVGLKVKKTDDGWRVSQAGRYQEDYQTGEEEFHELENVYRLR